MELEEIHTIVWVPKYRGCMKYLGKNYGVWGNVQGYEIILSKIARGNKLRQFAKIVGAEETNLSKIARGNEMRKLWLG